MKQHIFLRASAICTLAFSMSLVACSGGFSPLAPAAVPAASTAPAPSSAPTSAPPSGNVTLGTPTFNGGGSGNCNSGGLAFTGAGQSATITVSESGYSGGFTVTDEAPSVASAAINGSTLTVTALQNGTDFIAIADSKGNKSGCNIGVTTTTGTAN